MIGTFRNRTPDGDGPDWQRALYLPLTILAWLAVIFVAVWLLAHVAKTVLTLIFAGIVAFALTPLVGLLSRWIPRPLAIAVAYILGFLVLFGLIGVLVVTVAQQITNLVHSLPHYATQFNKLEPRLIKLLHPLGVTSQNFHSTQSRLIAQAQSLGSTVAKDSLGILAGIVGTIVDLVLVLILSVYLTANGPKIASNLRQETPRTQRWRANLLIGVVDQVVGGYIRGTLTLATLIGALVGVGLFIIGVPYAALLGVLAFFMEFIPIVGVLISGAASILIALLKGWPTALIVLAYFVVIHVIEGDLVGPRIMGRAVGIHPATAIIALVAGTELFGFWGALLAAPLAGLVQAIGIAAWREFRGGRPEEVLQAVVEKQKVEAEHEAEKHRQALAEDEVDRGAVAK